MTTQTHGAILKVIGPNTSICGNVLGALSSESDEITCRRCRTALAKSFPTISSYSRSTLWGELLTAEQNALVNADAEVARARRHVVDQGEEILRLLRSVAEDVARTIAQIKVLGADSYGALDRAMEMARPVSFIAGNVRIDLLARYGAELEQAIATAIAPTLTNN